MNNVYVGIVVQNVRNVTATVSVKMTIKVDPTLSGFPLLRVDKIP